MIGVPRLLTFARISYWLCVVTNVAAFVVNLAFIGGELATGRSIVGSTFATIVAVAVIYGVTVLDNWSTAQVQVLRAQLRNTDALAALHEDVLAKMKTARSVTIEAGETGARSH